MQFTLNVFTADDRAFFLELIEEAVTNATTKRSVTYHRPEAGGKGLGVVATPSEPLAVDMFVGSPSKGEFVDAEVGRRTYVALGTVFAAAGHDPELDGSSGAWIEEAGAAFQVTDVQKGDLGTSLYYVFQTRRS